MSQDAGTDRTVSIEADGVSVQKGFEPDAFAVPTIKIRITSEREQPVDFRLVDRIPDDFPMDGVGFHPDFGSERWTAYKNNRVVFETTLEAGETVETVYGIRISTAEQATEFLEEPSITVTPATDSESSEHESETEPDEDLGDSLDETSVSDLVAEETSGLVREFIRGDRDILPGIGLRADDETGAERPDAEVEPAPAADASPSVDGSVDDGIDGVDIGEDDIASHGDASTERSERSAESDASVGIEELDEDVLPTFDHDEERSTTAETVDVDTADTADPTEEESPTKSTTEKPQMDQQIESTGSGTATQSETADRSGVAAQLAAEIEAGQVSDDDLSIILSAVERESATTTTSVNTQIDHLQSRVSELDAYTEAFAAFLDEEGTGQRIVDDMQREIDSVRGDLDEVRTELGSTGDRLNGTTNRLDDTVSDLSHVEEQVTTVSERVDSIADRHDSAIDRIEERLDRLEHALESETGELESTLEGVRDDLTAVEEGIDELVSWRDQLGEMFSGR